MKRVNGIKPKKTSDVRDVIMTIFPDPKPRKKIQNKAYLEWLMTKPCLYCNAPALEPHHIRWGYGDGKGSGNSKPDDYRAINTCWKCHRALEGTDSKRLEWMTKKMGREDVYSAMVDNLIKWILKEKT